MSQPAPQVVRIGICDTFDTGSFRISSGINSHRDWGPSEPYARIEVLPKRNIAAWRYAIIRVCGP